MAIWVNLNRADKFPEVIKVYKRAGHGQGGTEAQAKGFLTTVRLAVTSGAALPSWIRKAPGASNDWQDSQVDVTAIPGVRALNQNGKAKVFIA